MLRILVLVSLFAHTACESCEWTYGSIQVQGRLTVKGPRPADLVVTTCKTARGEDCTGPGQLSEELGVLRYSTGIPSVGTWTCDFDQRWLRVTGTDCTPTVIEVLTSGEGAPAVPDPANLDVTLFCGVSTGE